MKRTAFLTAALVGLAALPVYGQDVLTSDPTLSTTRVATRGAAALQLGVGARAQAMAGAYGAMANDISALHWNTAGIAQLDGFSAGFTHASLYGDVGIDHTFVGAVLPVGLSRFGVSLNTLSSGSMPWVDEQFPNPGPYGEDVNPSRSEFEWTSTAVGLHFARPITDRLVSGAAVKFITEGINGADASFVALDLGTQFETGLYGLTLGAALTNLGTRSSLGGSELNTRVNTGSSETQVGNGIRIIGLGFETQEVDLPTAFRFSIMADLLGTASSIFSGPSNSQLRLVWDLSDAVTTDLQTSVGMEYSFNDMAFLRAGKRWTNEAQISYDFVRNASIGGGVRLPVFSFGQVRLDYAYTDMGDLENIQVFTIDIGF